MVKPPTSDVACQKILVYSDLFTKAGPHRTGITEKPRSVKSDYKSHNAAQYKKIIIQDIGE